MAMLKRDNNGVVKTKRPQISRDKLVGWCDIPSDDMKCQLSQPKSKGIISRVGSDKGGQWEVIG